MAKNRQTECEQWYYLSLKEVTGSFGVSSETIIEIVEQGIIPVEKDKPEDWRFDSKAIGSIRTILQLNKDLGVNIAGAVLALELIREIDRLRGLIR